MLYIKDNITINVINTFMNPENHKEMMTFKEVNNNIVSTNTYIKPYLWNEHIEMRIDSDKEIQNITKYTTHHYSHPIGISGSHDMKPEYLSLTNNKLIILNKKLGHQNEHCKSVNLQYQTKFLDSDTQEELFSYIIDYTIDDRDNILD